MEKMTDFFAARVDGYDKHMLQNVEGAREGYRRLAALVPDKAKTLLDLGCGTGLELDEVFRRLPDIAVTGIDLCPDMLAALRAKHPDKRLTLRCESYFDSELGSARYDAAISMESLHHFPHAQKRELYSRVYRSLKPGGVYAECDYMVETQAEEQALFNQNAHLRSALAIPEGAFYHFDTPCTIVNQIRLLQQAGFARVQKLWREGATTLLLAQK